QTPRQQSVSGEDGRSLSGDRVSGRCASPVRHGRGWRTRAPRSCRRRGPVIDPVVSGWLGGESDCLCSVNDVGSGIEGEVSMIRQILVSLAFAVVMLAADALAHHNMTAIFDFNDRVTLNGTLTQIDWRNPHTYLTLDVHGASGGANESWSAEGPSPTWFRIR